MKSVYIPLWVLIRDKGLIEYLKEPLESNYANGYTNFINTNTFRNMIVLSI